MQNQLYDSVGNVLYQALGEVTLFIPRVAAALILLLVGIAIARTLKRVLIKILEALRVSKALKKTPVEHFLKNAEAGQKVEGILGSVFYWLVMLVVLHTVVAVLGLSSLSLVLEKFLSYVPQILSAVLVLFLGVLLSGVVESFVKGAIKSMDGKSARLLGKVSSYLVMSLAVLAAISELGIASEFIMIIFVGFISTLVIGFGLALGLGGKEVVGKALSEWYDKTRKDISR